MHLVIKKFSFFSELKNEKNRQLNVFTCTFSGLKIEGEMENRKLVKWITA